MTKLAGWTVAGVSGSLLGALMALVIATVAPARAELLNAEEMRATIGADCDASCGSEACSQTGCGTTSCSPKQGSTTLCIQASTGHANTAISAEGDATITISDAGDCGTQAQGTQRQGQDCTACSGSFGCGSTYRTCTSTTQGCG
jgi:hypothetical protein